MIFTDFSDAITRVHRAPLANSRPEDNDIYNKIVSPYPADAFAASLRTMNAEEDHPLLIRHLTYGFPIGDLPKLTQNVIISNAKSVADNLTPVMEWIDTELGAGRISGPYTLSRINEIARGPIYCSPLLVVVTESAPGVPKYRICQNFSKGDKRTNTPAINAMTHKADYPCCLDTATHVADFVANSPVGTRGCSFDLSAFHRTVAIHPDHKPYLVFHLGDNFYFPHTNSFGMSPASSHAGQIGEPIRRRFEFEGLDPTFRYEDDLHACITPTPDGMFEKDGHRYTFDPDDSIGALSRISDLKLPMQLKKCGTEFSVVVPYIGFAWDYGPVRRCSLLEPKRIKFISRLESLLTRIGANLCLSLKDLEKIHGTLLHASFVYQDGSSHLPPIIAAMYGFLGNYETMRHASKSLRKTLEWWLSRLRTDSPYRILHPIRAQQDLGLYVDASTSWGVGILIGDQWYALELGDMWKSREKRGHGICWLEAVALELLYYFLGARGLQNCRLLVHSDNYGAIGALRKGRSKNEAINLCARRCSEYLARHLIVADVIYVASAENPADPISRGILGPPEKRLTRDFTLPRDIDRFLKDDRPRILGLLTPSPPIS